MLGEVLLAGVVLAVVICVVVVVMLAHRLADSRHDYSDAEARLESTAMEIAFGDRVTPVAAGDVAVLSGLLRRYSTRVNGEAGDRVNSWLLRHGRVGLELDRLTHRHSWRRATAAYLLGDMGAVVADAALMTALEDSAAEVRAAAARSLGRLKVAPAVPALVAALEAGTIPRGIAAYALYQIGTPSIPSLLALLASDDSFVRSTAAELVGLLGDANHASLLLGLADDTDPSVRAQAARALGRLGAASVFATLASLLEDDDDEVQAAAAQALGSLSDPRASRLLLKMADEAAFSPGRAAASALGRIDRDLLARAAGRHDASPHLRAAADTAALSTDDV